MFCADSGSEGYPAHCLRPTQAPLCTTGVAAKNGPEAGDTGSVTTRYRAEVREKELRATGVVDGYNLSPFGCQRRTEALLAEAQTRWRPILQLVAPCHQKF